MSLSPTDRDPSANPGVDFYRFANGGWLDANPIPAGYGSWGSFEEVSRRNEVVLRELLERRGREPEDELDGLLGDAFAAGLDLEAIEAGGIEPIAPLLRAIEGATGHGDVLALLPALHRSGLFALFGWDVTVDHDDSSRNLLWLVQAAARAPGPRDVLRRGGGRRRPARRVRRARRARSSATSGRRGRRTAAAAVLAFETRLAELHLRAEERRDPDRTHNRYDRAALAALAPALDLPGYLDALGAGAAESVNVENPAPAGRASTRSSRRPSRPPCAPTWRSRSCATVADALPARIDAEDFAFYGRRIRGQQEQHERAKRVIDAIGADLGEALAKRYVAPHFPPEAKERAARMVEAIVEEMRASIRTREWMSDETRAYAEAKLDAMRVKIGYPDRWRDWSGLEIGRDSYAANRLTATRFELDRRLAKLAAAGRPRRVGAARPHRQRLLPPDAQRDRRPGRDPAAADVRRRRRRRRQLRRHRHGDRPRDHARLRRPGPPLRRPRAPARLVDARGRGPLHRAGRPAGRRSSTPTSCSTTSTSTAA